MINLKFAEQVALGIAFIWIFDPRIFKQDMDIRHSDLDILVFDPAGHFLRNKDKISNKEI